MTRAERRIRSSCCPVTGLSEPEFERHVRAIVRTVVVAKRRRRERAVNGYSVAAYRRRTA